MRMHMHMHVRVRMHMHMHTFSSRTAMQEMVPQRAAECSAE